MERKRKRIPLFFWIPACILLIAVSYSYVRESIPDEIKMIVDEEQEFQFGLPVSGTILNVSNTIAAQTDEEGTQPDIHLNFQEPFTLRSGETGQYTMNCKLFGFIDLKQVSVQVVEQRYLTPCGMPVGIYLETKGVLIIGTGTITGIDGVNYEPAYQLVQSGDYIKQINDRTVSNKDELMKEIAYCAGEDIVLGIQRNGSLIQRKITPVETAPDEYKLGIWVRDSAQGIGTVTYMENEEKFGALGHGINDIDTNTLMELSQGTLYEAEIIGIVKGENGNPGELSGKISYRDDKQIGSVDKNSNAGIFGTLQHIPEEYKNLEKMEVGLKQEIKTGPATIRSYVSGQLVDYEIEIMESDLSNNELNKGIIFQVTDSRLLELTGGIVQGMSGSPIIQNSKLIGAVTHVFVQDSTKGYGIFIENMLEQ